MTNTSKTAIDFEINRFLGRWEINAWDYSANLGYEETTIATFSTEAACFQAWDMMFDYKTPNTDYRYR